MSRVIRRRTGLAVSALAYALVVSGCGAARIGDADSGAAALGSGASCGSLTMAMSSWVGYTADAAVYKYVADNQLGCKVVQKDIKEQLAWQGFGTGQVDAIIENWGHPDLVKKYIQGQKTAIDAGPTGNRGVIGWWVPPWLAKAHPDILNWRNLNKYAKQFATSESGGKGQLLDGDPSYVTNDEALVKNLNLNYKVVYAGSETALISAYRNAERTKSWAIGYWYSPQWFLSEVPMKHIPLPAYTPGCDDDASAIRCDYPAYTLNKIVSTRFARSGSPAYWLLKNFSWTDDDQNAVARSIAVDHMTPAAAAEKWVKAHKDTVNTWLLGIPGAKPLQ